ncbi:MAG: hypothetical protein J6W56_12190 [Prevotella sp.]|nr:hypothetical protein [Prevotella sp.]
MKRTSNITRLAVAVALLFAVNMNANAQLGGLLNKAKKTVTQDAGQSAQEKRVKADYVKDHPQEQEKAGVQAAGGMDKYLGLDKTENGRILWKYASMEPDEYRKTMQIHNAFDASKQIVQVLRYMKGNTETFEMYHQQSVVLDIFNTRIPNNLKAAAKATKNGAAVPAKDIAAIKAEAARVKKMYMERTGATEKSTEQKKAEADDAYVQEIIDKNYLLDDLTDKNRQAKAVADYKAKVNAKVKQQLAPTKILGTYSTSVAWQGLPLQNYPELKEKYDAVQEMRFKTFYQKGGKYYVVKSAFRQSIDKGDNKSGAQPQKFYWPGLETPVEIPAEKIQGKF